MAPFGLCLTHHWCLSSHGASNSPWHNGTVATGICCSGERPAQGKDFSGSSVCKSGVQWTTLQGRGNGKQGQFCQTPVTSCGCSVCFAVHTAEPLQQQLDAAWSMQSPGRINLEVSENAVGWDKAMVGI